MTFQNINTHVKLPLHYLSSLFHFGTLYRWTGLKVGDIVLFGRSSALVSQDLIERNTCEENEDEGEDEDEDEVDIYDR